LTFEKFKEYYEKYGKCINDVSKPKKKYSEQKLKERYGKLLKQLERNAERKKVSVEKQQEKKKEFEEVDYKWEEMKEIVFSRDKSKCQLISFLEEFNQFDTARELRESAGNLVRTIDPAHIYPRSTCPELKYDPDNVVCLNRFSHSMLDTFRDPVDGRQVLNIEERLLYFQLIVGEERMERLKLKIKNQ